jgi:hypothetical protein
VKNSDRRLALYHFWVAFAVFLPAVALGAWQMLMRSPLPAPLDDTNAYYASVTLHGTAMAYVVTTFFAMGLGYAVIETSLGRPVRGVIAAWIGFMVCLVGTVMAVVTVLSGRASVLYTFYPPLLASPWYYFGAFLLIGGSMIWVVLMIYNMSAWKRDNPGQPVPLVMFAITATAILWAWAASGVLIELLFVLIPQALGITTQIDAGLGRTLFTVTLHAIVYFWLMPRVYRLLHARPPSCRRTPLQRHLRAAHLHQFHRSLVACRVAPHLRRPGDRRWIQVPAVVLDLLCCPSDAADGVLALRQPRNRRTGPRRTRPFGLDLGVAVAGTDGSGRGLVIGDARPRRLWRTH